MPGKDKPDAAATKFRCKGAKSSRGPEGRERKEQMRSPKRAGSRRVGEGEGSTDVPAEQGRAGNVVFISGRWTWRTAIQEGGQASSAQRGTLRLEKGVRFLL